MSTTEYDNPMFVKYEKNCLNFANKILNVINVNKIHNMIIAGKPSEVLYEHKGRLYAGSRSE